MRRSNIPPRTMRSLSLQSARPGPIVRTNLGSVSSMRAQTSQAGSPREAEPSPSTGLFRKPRNWHFQTKPLFKKLHGPLIDVFDEADEVLIVIDLSGFQPGEVSLQLTPQKYVIHARRGREVFQEEIFLPPEVDLSRCVEQFRNGILEINLPRRTGAPPPESDQ